MVAPMLVLAVDRDDDIGRKAEIAGPILGRAAVLEAAMRLGVADPCDSDTNALFSAVSHYDNLIKNRDESETIIAAITGDSRLGLRADEELARQLDEILDKTGATRVFLITDGAEDEQILPLIQARARVASIHRNIVSQAPRIESFVYMMGRAMEDDKFAKRFLLPAALIVLIWSAAFFLKKTEVAVGLTLGILGSWMLVQSMHWERRVITFFQDFRRGAQTGRLALVSLFIAIMILFLGALESYQRAKSEPDTLVRWLLALDVMVPFIVSAVLVRIGGRLLESALGDGGLALFQQWMNAFTVLALGLMGGAALDAGIGMAKGGNFVDVFAYDVAVRGMGGLLVFLAGLFLARYVRKMFDGTEAE